MSTTKPNYFFKVSQLRPAQHARQRGEILSGGREFKRLGAEQGLRDSGLRGEVW
jgi:hypothetical protein